MGKEFLGAGFVLLMALLAPATAAEVGLCPRDSAAEAILMRRDSCSASDSPVAGGGAIGVVEGRVISLTQLHLAKLEEFAQQCLAFAGRGDEAALQMALNLVYKHRKEYVALLFHASWCPFSKICRPNFDTMSSMFPAIRHFAFEQSVIRPSILSRYGVHGFPTLFLLNSTMRVRYHGSRTINSLVTFYSDVTGIKPTPVPMFLEKAEDPISPSEPKEDAEQENCPFAWARSPEKLLQQHTYLALASSFVLLRMLYFLLPRLKSCILRAWNKRIRYASWMSISDYFQACLLQAKHSFNRLNPGKRSEFQDGAMQAKAWASKSLASVSIGEPNCGISHSPSERR